MNKRNRQSFNLEDAEKLKNIGNESFKIGNFATALDYYNRALEIDSSNPKYHCNKATVLIKLEKYKDALESATEAVILDNRYIKAYTIKGVALENLNNKDDAKIMYNAVLNLDSTNKEALDGLKRLNKFTDFASKIGFSDDIINNANKMPNCNTQ